nr:protein BIG GRAIN 1-like B [Tanacetum cinerariifolium]
MYTRGRENPSFSSSLLDEIYRSIDQPDDEKEKSFYAKSDRCFLNDYECEKVLVRRRTLVDVKRSINFTSSSSSGSSCGGGFSSSETESVYGLPKPKPIRTTTKHSNSYGHRYELEDLQPKKHESKFVKTKSRAMKIYGDLKKAKQPISPGGRLASFLNSIFTSNNAKNTKSVPRTYEHNHMKSKSVNASTCSSASSFSRSCLSKTPSSRGKSTNNNKSRSVHFVIVEDEHSHNSQKTVRHSSQKTRKIEEAARNLLKNYQKKVECLENYVTNNVKDHNEIEMRYDDDDDDVSSNASSDLFELENFAVIGNEKYGDELPVYGTTCIDMNIM